MIYIVLLQLENHTAVYPFMWDILHCQSMNFNPIHPLIVSHSSIKWMNLSTEFHEQLVTFHRSLLRLQTIKAIVNSRNFKSPKSDEPRRVQVLDLYCLTRFESESSSREIVY